MVTHKENKHNSRIPPKSRSSDTSTGESLQQLQDCYVELNLDEDTNVDVLKTSFNDLLQRALTDENTSGKLTEKKLIEELKNNNEYIPQLTEIFQVALHYCVDAAKTNIRKKPNLAWAYANETMYWVGILKGIMIERRENDASINVRKAFERTDDSLAKAFDPVPLSTIAKVFPVDRDEEQNQKKWRNFAAKASRNGLNETRVSTGRGRAESTFNLWLVGEWVIPNLGFTQDIVNRKLASNLPERSKDMKDLILL